MIRLIAGVAAVIAASSFMPHAAQAYVCGNGYYRAGCAGPNGGAVVRKPYYGSGYYHHPHYYRPPVYCAHGYYHSGCVRR